MRRSSLEVALNIVSLFVVLTAINAPQVMRQRPTPAPFMSPPPTLGRKRMPAAFPDRPYQPPMTPKIPEQPPLSPFRPSTLKRPPPPVPNPPLSPPFVPYYPDEPVESEESPPYNPGFPDFPPFPSRFFKPQAPAAPQAGAAFPPYLRGWANWDTAIYKIDLSRNNIQGTIPETWNALVLMNSLDLSDNPMIPNIITQQGEPPYGSYTPYAAPGTPGRGGGQNDPPPSDIYTPYVAPGAPATNDGEYGEPPFDIYTPYSAPATPGDDVSSPAYDTRYIGGPGRVGDLSYFDLSCPPSSFVTGVQGWSGNVLEGLAISCSDGSTPGYVGGIGIADPSVQPFSFSLCVGGFSRALAADGPLGLARVAFFCWGNVSRAGGIQSNPFWTVPQVGDLNFTGSSMWYPEANIPKMLSCSGMSVVTGVVGYLLSSSPNSAINGLGLKCGSVQTGSSSHVQTLPDVEVDNRRVSSVGPLGLPTTPPQDEGASESVIAHNSVCSGDSFIVGILVGPNGGSMEGIECSSGGQISIQQSSGRKSRLLLQTTGQGQTRIACDDGFDAIQGIDDDGTGAPMNIMLHCRSQQWSVPIAVGMPSDAEASPTVIACPAEASVAVGLQLGSSATSSLSSISLLCGEMPQASPPFPSPPPGLPAPPAPMPPPASPALPLSPSRTDPEDYKGPQPVPWHKKHLDFKWNPDPLPEDKEDEDKKKEGADDDKETNRGVVVDEEVSDVKVAWYKGAYAKSKEKSKEAYEKSREKSKEIYAITKDKSKELYEKTKAAPLPWKRDAGKADNTAADKYQVAANRMENGNSNGLRDTMGAVDDDDDASSSGKHHKAVDGEGFTNLMGLGVDMEDHSIGSIPPASLTGSSASYTHGSPDTAKGKDTENPGGSYMHDINEAKPPAPGPDAWGGDIAPVPQASESSSDDVQAVDEADITAIADFLDVEGSEMSGVEEGDGLPPPKVVLAPPLPKFGSNRTSRSLLPPTASASQRGGGGYMARGASFGAQGGASNQGKGDLSGGYEPSAHSLTRPVYQKASNQGNTGLGGGYEPSVHSQTQPVSQRTSNQVSVGLGKGYEPSVHSLTRPVSQRAPSPQRYAPSVQRYAPSADEASTVERVSGNGSHCSSDHAPWGSSQSRKVSEEGHASHQRSTAFAGLPDERDEAMPQRTPMQMTSFK
eukprot:gene5095-34895_t